MGTNDVSRRQALVAGAALAGSAALTATAFGAGPAAAATAHRSSGQSGQSAKPTIVLVHGGYADSSCWNDTIAQLQGAGYPTICGSNALARHPDRCPYIASLLDSISGPVVLVAHSMGGTVITNAAAGKANVKALVYIAAFVPDVGETQGELITKFPGSEVGPVSVPVPCTNADGTTGTDLYLGQNGKAAFAADISTSAFRVLQATQRPFDADSFIFPTTAAAWKTIPTWALVTGRDKAIPPAAQRFMYAGRTHARSSSCRRRPTSPCSATPEPSPPSSSTPPRQPAEQPPLRQFATAPARRARAGAPVLPRASQCASMTRRHRLAVTMTRRCALSQCFRERGAGASLGVARVGGGRWAWGRVRRTGRHGIGGRPA